MSRSDPQVNFRMPAELKAKLEEAAARNKRSTTAEIVARLEASFQETPSFEYAVIADEAHRNEPKFSEADIKKAIDQVFGKLLYEHIALTASPTAKLPQSKTDSLLDMDQAEEEAKLKAENETPKPTTRPERRIRRN
ncbi:Arc family DNA-binding protein [Phytopseudomonas dryadis]|uniref:Arc-like DNA binding domain-containing protein n=1 Tax=Phytopseudomonas dryadis TaxID=2487520 RepID=A0A4Q9QU16_9GAMM|nr:Arc family DNA-binding protein [Pseudomonas dryadis]TBU86777.1 hypothetical protein DNK44_21985 [Pseudomonas dryadis]